MAQGGDITLRIASAQAGKSAAGLTTCEIEFEVANEMAEPIKFLAAFWRPIVVEGNVTMHNAIDARGDQRLYAGKVPPGEVKGRTGKVDGVDCKFITGIRLWDVTCGLDSRADCKDRVSVENHSQLALNP